MPRALSPHRRRTRSVVYGAMMLLCLSAGMISDRSHAAVPPPDFVRVTLKFLPRTILDRPVPLTLQPNSCPTCRQMYEADFARENTRETIVELLLPRGRSLSLTFEAPNGVFHRAVMETTDMTLTQRSDHTLEVELPPLDTDATSAGEFATHVTGTGYVLRFEHADPVRRFGAYIASLPADARKAADNIEFGLREAVIELGLGQAAASQQLGIIEIMGFDTNEPHGHRDAPPHVHMHLRWPYNVGTQIGHFYINREGSLDHIRVGIAGLHMPTRDYAAGQTFPTISPKGQVFYTQTITKDGNLRLAARDGRQCEIGLPGDDRRIGVHVHCDGHPKVFIHVTDDMLHGILETHTGSITETFRYDTGTGLLLSPQRQPAPPLSAVVPRYTGLTEEAPAFPPG